METEIEIAGIRVKVVPVHIVQDSCIELGNLIITRQVEAARTRERLHAIETEISNAMDARKRMMDWLTVQGH